MRENLKIDGCVTSCFHLFSPGLVHDID